MAVPVKAVEFILKCVVKTLVGKTNKSKKPNLIRNKLIPNITKRDSKSQLFSE